MKTFAISGYNRERGADELIIYNGSGNTKTNSYGFEACVVDGRVISCGKNNNVIPNDGFVVSGHGEAADFLANNLCIGARAEIDEANGVFIAEIDDTAKQIETENNIYKIKEVPD